MSFQLRHQAWGLAIAVAGFAIYWTVIVVRSVSDDESFTHVAWQHPLLWFIGLGAGAYAVIFGAAWWSTRGQVRTDERDAEIARRADAAGSGLTTLGALAAMILLALDHGAFWAAHVILVSSFLGSVASTGLSMAAYTKGLDQ